MIDFVSLLQPAEDGNRVLHCGLIHHDRLETALQGGVLLNVHAVLLESRRADAVQLAAGQHGLEHIAGIHRAVGLAGADDRMQLINEKQNLAVASLDVLEDSLETLLEFAAVLGARDQGSHIQGKDLFIFEPVRHIAPGDPLGKPLHDGGLADAGLTDQDRVVLGLSGKNSDHIADLRVPADDWIHLLRFCLGDELFAVFFKRFVSGFGIIAGHTLVAAHCGKRLEEALAADSIIPEKALQRTVRVLDQGQEQMLYAHILVAQSLCFRLSSQQSLVHLSADINPAVAAVHLCEALYGPQNAVGERTGINAHLFDEPQDQAVLQRQQAVQQMLLFDLLVPVFIGQLLALVDRFN